MKIVKPKFLLNGRYTEVYGLEDLYHPWSENKSLTACYLLCKTPGITVKKLSIEAHVPEIGTPAPWSVSYDAERFAAEEKTLAGFLRKYDQPEFWNWYLVTEYQGIRVAFAGDNGNANVRCSYAKEETVKLMPLLLQVENASYEHSDFADTLVAQVAGTYKLTTKRAVQTLDKLSLHSDIYREFVSCGLRELQPFPGSEIRVEGFSAWELHKKYPLSLLGAYNYLIHLRESPAEALADLKKGLPRR
jgi:hypothetical protein